jgi:hypothetical protein
MPLPLEIVCWLVCFLLFTVTQSLIINGIFYCWEGGCRKDLTRGEVCEGMIFYPFRRFLEKHISEWWQKPLFKCVRCGASVYGTVTFWPIVLWVFGFQYWQIGIWIVDIFILVYLNYFFYKKL